MHNCSVSSLRVEWFCMTATAIVIAEPAYAYIDPGSGSLLLQLIIASGIGVALKFRRFIRIAFESAVRFVKKSFRK